MGREERHLPRLDTEIFRKAATMIPMLNAEWQAGNDPGSEEEAEKDLRFRYDGQVIPNTKVPGHWRTVTHVNEVADFNPKAKNTLTRPLFKEIELRADGSTNSPAFLWSGDVLMDLDRTQALKIPPKTIDGGDYLFIEAGGFDLKNPVGWKPQLMVLKRR